MLAYVIIFYYLCNRNKDGRNMIQNNKIDLRSKYRVGQYHYGRHRSSFGVWVCKFVTETTASSTFITDFQTREEARQFVWKMNGWGIPKTTLAR